MNVTFHTKTQNIIESNILSFLKEKNLGDNVLVATRLSKKDVETSNFAVTLVEYGTVHQDDHVDLLVSEVEQAIKKSFELNSINIVKVNEPDEEAYEWFNYDIKIN